MGYHKRKIKKGKIGEFSKIQEEFDELSDAYEQGDKILQLCELADLLGAISMYTENKFNINLSDIKEFSDKTRQAFEEGKRQ